MVPYLATRCLVQLGQISDNPEISTIIQKDFYVDHLLSGADTVEQCYNMFQKLISVHGVEIRQHSCPGYLPPLIVFT